MNSSIRTLFFPGLLRGMFKARPVLMSVWLLMISACGQHASVSSVDPLAQEFFEALQDGNLDKAMDMYSQDFFDRFPKEIWREKLQRLSADLGPIKAYSFRNKQADSRYSGKFYIYQYDTIHDDTIHDDTIPESGDKEKRAKHTITFIQPIDSAEIKIAGHMIRAPGFD